MAYGGAVIAILTAPVFLIKIGLPSRHWWPTGTEAGEGLDALSAMGVAGFIQPMRVLVRGARGTDAWWRRHRSGACMTLSDSLRADPRVREVRSLVDVQAKGSRCSATRCSTAISTAARGTLPGFPRRLPQHATAG